MARVYVSIGSNIDREANIRAGVGALRERHENVVLSSVYDTEPVGFDGANFYNLVAGFDTAADVHNLARYLRGVEENCGRARSNTRFAPRTLDIDLLLYDDLVLEVEGLKLPRDEILKYAFVLGPLAEIAARERHPVLGTSFEELWQAFDAAYRPLRRVDFLW